MRKQPGLAALFLGVVAITATSIAGQLMPEAIPRMSVAHHNAGVVESDGKVYVWTGYTNSGPAHYDRTRALEIYDPSANTWSLGEDIPEAGSGIGEFALNGAIYSIGGEKSPSGSFADSVHRYNVASDTWTPLNNFPTNIWDPMSVVCGGKGYIIGGRRGYGRTYPDVYEYDEPNDAWVKKADMLYDVFLAPAVSCDGKIYVFGGVHKTSEASQERVLKVQIYDLTSNTWGYGVDMPYRLYNAQGLLFDNDIWLFSGRIYDEGSNEWVDNNYAYQFDPDTNVWTAHQFIPPTQTRYGSQIALVGEYAYFTDTSEDGSRSTFAYRVPIPEPAALSLLAVGWLVVSKRRRKS